MTPEEWSWIQTQLDTDDGYHDWLDRLEEESRELEERHDREEG